MITLPKTIGTPPVTSAQILAALGYTPMNKAGDTMTGDLLFTDALYDIGKTGATRPRDLFLSRNLTIGGTASFGGNVVSDLLFTDATFDIGKTGATRPRDGFFSRNVTVGGDEALASTSSITWNADTTLKRDGAANTLALVNGANLGDFRVYGAAAATHWGGMKATSTSRIAIGAFGDTGMDLMIISGAANHSLFNGAGGIQSQGNNGNSYAFDYATNATSLTGANQSTFFNIAQTWNTSGNPTLIKAVVTRTAVGNNATSKLIDLQTGAGTMFNVDTTGLLTATGGISTAGIAATGSILSSGTAGIGYSAGAGGTVAQGTSKATTVVLSKLAGTITLNAAALASVTSVAFTWTNTLLTATDFVEIQHDSVGTLGGYSIVVTPAAGSATVTVRNNTAGSLSEAIVLRFLVTKSVIT